MTDPAIRAKALEIAVLIKGGDVLTRCSDDGELVIGHYYQLAEKIERYIRGDWKPSSAKSAENR